jgi:hypothetical protein
MTKHTREKWEDRIREWQQSGKSPKEFTADKDYEASSLRWAITQLGREKASRVARDVSSRVKATGSREEIPSSASRSRPPRFVPVRMRRVAESASTEVVVEVGGARIRVTPGVDVGLLGEVVRALEGVGR